MLEIFQEHIKNSFPELLGEGSFLLAFSGGVDSTVLGEMLHRSGVKFETAHCNFNLRGQESDADEQFARHISSKDWGVRCHVASFETATYSQEHGLSIEMAARELRYGWFERLRQEYGFKAILTAHNLNDQAETVLLNLTRGTSLEGLRGMSDKNGHVWRPFLETERRGIENFAKNMGISWREDSSNAQTKYQRNKIRHSVIPVLEQINPSFLASFEKNNRYLKDFYAHYRSLLEKEMGEILKKNDDLIYINIEKIKQNRTHVANLLFEILKPYGFVRQIPEIIAALEGAIPGTAFFDNGWRLLRDREHFILEKILPADEYDEYYIDCNTVLLSEPFSLKCASYDYCGQYLPFTDTHKVFLDADLLSFPLKMRRWREGDYFIPFGMNGKKKLSKYFKDKKLSLSDKEKVWVLTSGGDVVWIAAMRSDDRYKVTPQTKRVFEIEILKEK